MGIAAKVGQTIALASGIQDGATLPALQKAMLWQLCHIIFLAWLHQHWFLLTSSTHRDAIQKAGS